ncbi:unnamed protein product, partial [marine sediment metagenome]
VKGRNYIYTITATYNDNVHENEIISMICNNPYDHADG